MKQANHDELGQQMSHGDPKEALQGILAYNMGKWAGSVHDLDTRAISNRVRELLYTRNISQRTFAKHVLGMNPTSVSIMLSKSPKSWEKLTKRTRHHYRVMHAWCYDEDAITMLKLLMPKKSKWKSNTKERAQREQDHVVMVPNPML